MRDTMQLQEVEAVHPEFLVGFKNGLSEVLFTVTVGVDFATGLGCNRDAVTLFLKEFPDDAFAASRAIDIGGVEEAGSAALCSRKDLVAGLLVEGAEFRPSQLPATQSYFPNFKSICAESACFHSLRNGGGVRRIFKEGVPRLAEVLRGRSRVGCKTGRRDVCGPLGDAFVGRATTGYL